MLSKRLAPALFVLILSGLMSCMVSAVATLVNLGLPPDYLPHWLRAWAVAWPVAFVVGYGMRAPVQRLVERLTG